MRKHLFKVLLTISFLLHITSSFSQRPNLKSGYYVVVGVYAQSREELAISYADRIKSMGYDAGYGFNESRKQYYVYLKHFTDLGSSVSDMLATRRGGVFTDAWVKVIRESPGAEPPTVAAAESAVIPDKDAASVPPESTEMELRLPKTTTEAREEQPAEGVREPNESVVSTVSRPADNRPPRDTEVFLSLFNATNHQPIEGVIKVIDSKNHRLIGTAMGNQSLSLAEYKSPSGNIIFLADVFGYRKMQRELDLKNLTNDTVRSYVEMLDTALVVFFDMVRYHKGDIVTLYNVYFHNDAAIMLPESKYELNSLVTLMKENPGYRIRIHGHSNGNYHGKIISMASSKDHNFFDINGPVHEGLGSARELSKRRAETLREYLLAQEIDPERVSIKAWGGRRPVYNQNSVHAGKNIRVEVEIVDE